MIRRNDRTSSYRRRRRGMAVIQSVLLIAMSAIMLIGLLQFFDSDQGVKGAASKMIAKLSSSQSSAGGAPGGGGGSGGEIDVKPAPPAGNPGGGTGGAGAGGSGGGGSSNSSGGGSTSGGGNAGGGSSEGGETAKDPAAAQRELESQLYSEWHALREEIERLKSQDPPNEELIALLEDRYRMVDRAISDIDKVISVGPSDEAIADFVADFTPIVSQIKAVYEVGTGTNPITGKELTDAERALAAAGVIPWGKVIAKGGKAIKQVGQGAVRQAFLNADDFAQLSRKGSIDPKRVRFSQDSIAANFKDGSSVGELADKLKNGLDPSTIPPVRIVEKNGKIFTLDNRRLRAFQEAGIEIPYKKLDKIPKREQFKFTTKNDGVDIVVRGQ